jgi:hypothetical protein
VVFSDPENTSIHFLFESFAEAVACLFIVGNGIKEFLLGLRQKGDPHGTRRFAASLITSW